MVATEAKHLTKGDPQPPVKKGVLRFYSNRICPFVQRVRLVLDAKKINYDLVNVRLDIKPEWLFEKSPTAKVPVIEYDDGRILDESLIISDFLDEQYPQRPLQPKDPYTKARDKLILERLGAAFPKALFGVLMNLKSFSEEKMEEMRTILDPLEKELADRKTKFFGGAEPGMLDLMMWPFIERFVVLKIVGPEIFKMDASRFGKLIEWKKAMMEQDFIQGSYLTPEDHLKFLDSRAAGKDDYNVGFA